MLFDVSLIAAATSTVLAVSFGLAADHYRRANRQLAGELRRHAEIADHVAEGDARYHAMFENAPMGCMVWEPGCAIVEWNSQAEHIFGWKRDEILGCNFISVLVPVHAREQVQREATRLFVDGRSHHSSTPHVRRDGSILTCEWHHAVMHDERGVPSRIVSLCLNVTGARELALENALFRNIIDSTGDPVAIVHDASDDVRVIYASASVFQHLGLRNDELIGKSPFDWDPSITREALARMREELKARKSVAFETTHRHADGRLIPVEVTANRVEHAGQSCIVTYSRNIAERKANEARLRDLEVKAAVQEQERRYREIFENSSDALFILEVRDGRYLVFDSVNPAAAAALGMPADSLPGTRFGEIAECRSGSEPGTTLADHVRHYLSRNSTGLATEYEGPLDLFPSRMGSARTFHVQIIPLVGDNGVARIICIGRDVTAYRQLVATLEQRAALQEQLASVAQAVPGFLFTIRADADGRTHLPFASAGVEDLFGVRQEDLNGDVEALRARYHPDDLPGVLDLMAETRRTLAPLRKEIRIHHPEKGERWIEIRSTPVRQPDGGTEWHGVMLDTTERRRMEAALEDSLRFARELIEVIPSPVFYKDIEGRYLGCNAAFERIFLGGRSRAEVIGKSVFDLWPRDLAERYHAADRQLFDNPGTQTYEATLGIDDTRRDVVFHKATFTHADGSIGGLVGVILDITERKQHENTLQARAALERQLSHLAANIPGFVYTFRMAPDGFFSYPFASPGIADIFTGLTPQDVATDAAPAGPFIHPDDLPDTLAAIRESARTLTPFRYEFRIRTAPEEYPRWVEARSVPERDADGGVTWYGIMLDATERKTAEVLLRKRQEEFLALAENSPDIIMRYDRECRRTYVNPAFIAQVGKSEAELLGRKPIDYSSAPGAVAYTNALLRAMESGGEVIHEYTWPAHGGKTIISDFRIVPERNADGEIVSVLAIGRDVTERKAMEAARETALGEARRLAQARSAFLARMSHELRTPLNGILGHAQNLLAHTRLDGGQIAALGIIQQSGDHLLAVIGDILDHAKMEADKLELVVDDLDTANLLHTVCGIIRIRAEQKGIGFRCEAAAELPGIVRGDAQRLRQVLLNLLGNAVKFTDRGEVVLRVGPVAAGRIRFAVHDTGVGIEASQQDAIFQTFEQVGDESRRAGGTGLGLAISRQLVRMMGSDIAVESRPGAGSVFSFEVEMPVVSATPAVLQQQAAPSQPAVAAPLPPADELDVLLNLARRGNMANIERHAAGLAERDATCRPFAEQVIRMARSYQSKAILKLIEQAREESPCP